MKKIETVKSCDLIPKPHGRATLNSGREDWGASYAAITYGPQLNNYRDLVKEIKDSDVNKAEPLSEEELRIVGYIAAKFPNEREVYEAAHREKVWRDAPIGSLIPYACAAELTEA